MRDRGQTSGVWSGVALGLLLVACKGAAPVQDADAGGAAAASDDATEPSPPVTETPPVAEQPPAEPSTASGCTDDADCDGGICEGEGCGPGEGTCQPRDRMCTRDLRPYCGCDGQTFHGSGSCPGKRFAHRGECSPGG